MAKNPTLGYVVLELDTAETGKSFSQLSKIVSDVVTKIPPIKIDTSEAKKAIAELCEDISKSFKNISLSGMPSELSGMTNELSPIANKNIEGSRDLYRILENIHTALTGISDVISSSAKGTEDFSNSMDGAAKSSEKLVTAMSKVAKAENRIFGDYYTDDNGKSKVTEKYDIGNDTTKTVSRTKTGDKITTSVRTHVDDTAELKRLRAEQKKQAAEEKKYADEVAAQNRKADEEEQKRVEEQARRMEQRIALRKKQQKAEEQATYNQLEAEQKAADKRAKQEESAQKQYETEQKKQAAEEKKYAAQESKRVADTYKSEAKLEEIRRLRAKATDYGVSSDNNEDAATVISDLSELETAYANLNNQIVDGSVTLEEYNNKVTELDAKLKLTRDSLNDQVKLQKGADSIKKLKDDIADLTQRKQFTFRVDTKEAKAAEADLRKLDERLDELFNEFKTKQIGPDEFAKRLSGLKKSVEESGKTLDRFTFSPLKHFKESFGDFGNTILSFFTFETAMRGLKKFVTDAVQTTRELEDALVELQMVTGGGGAEFDNYTKNVASVAQGISVATKDLITATTTYARLGYSLTDANELAKYTAMLEKVGDIQPDAAQDAITAMLAAFNEDVTVDNIEETMDKLVTVGKVIAQQYSNVLKETGYIG